MAPATEAGPEEGEEESDPEGEDEPEDDGGGLKDAPEEGELRCEAEVAGGEAEVEGAAAGGLVGEPEEGAGVAEDEKAGGGQAGGKVRGLEADDGDAEPEEGTPGGEGAGEGRRRIHLCVQIDLFI